jgi:trans-aconitate methyltransferase
VPPVGGEDQLELLLAEQIAYYRALAAEYEDHALDLPGGEELLSALDAFQPEGDVLEIACGPGFWTSRLLRHATTVTSLDAASEMLAIASARVDDERVRFIQADVFSWRPDRRYDVVFFGFWLSHVPAERFESFWSLIRDCVAPHVTVPYTASELEARVSRLGWQVTVTGTSGPFYWGSGSLRAPPRAVR